MSRGLIYIARLVKRLPDRQMLMVLSVVVGILAAVAGHVLKGSIHFVQGVANSFTEVADVNWLYLVLPTIGILLTVLFVRYWVKDNISHGVTRIFYAISRKDSRLPLHNTYSSVVASATTIGFGGSVGAEAPIVLTGAAIGSNMGQAMRLNYNHITLLLGCGAAAAIAAVYKAPIAGFAFVIEVLMLELTFTSVVPLLIASVTAATTTYLLVGIEPFFGSYTPTFALGNVPYYIVLGLIGGVLSYAFSVGTMRLERKMGRIGSPWVKILVGGTLLGGLIFIFPPLYGEGYSTIKELLVNDTSVLFSHSLFYNIQSHFSTLALYVAGILVFKVVAMTLTNASGGVGGTFAPSLFFGAMMGFFFATTTNHFFGADLPVGSFTLVGMACVMSGVMKAPITSMFLVAELTGGFQLFLPLMLCSAVSFALSYYFEPYSIYTKRLAQRGELLTHNKDENTLQFLKVGDLVERDFVAVEYGDQLREVIRAVERSNRNIFPVVQGEFLRGVVTLDDIRGDLFSPEKWAVTPLTDYMTKPPEVVLEGDDAREVLAKFERSDAWNLPVVDDAGRYVGFISKSRLLGAYRQELQKLSAD